MNLTTGGTISTSAKFAGGMVGATLGVGTVAITNCISGVTINSSVNGDGTHGGFLAVASYGAGLSRRKQPRHNACGRTDGDVPLE